MTQVTPQPSVLVVSRIVLDDLHHHDGTHDLGILGGSGFWAAFGASLVRDDAAVTCRVGTDFEPYYPVLERLGIRADGLVLDGEHTSRTVVTYPQPGQRHEEPLPNWDAHVAMRTMASEFPDSVAQPESYYVFRAFHPGFWEDLFARRNPGAPMLWEIPATICNAEHRDQVAQVLEHIEVLSINEEEAEGLTGHTHEVDQLAALHDLGAKVVALRLGSQGCITSDGAVRYRAAPPPGKAVDVTGAGNTFSGAMIAAWSQAPGDLLNATTAAMAASAVTVAQVGPAKDVADGRSRWAQHRQMINAIREEW